MRSSIRFKLSMFFLAMFVFFVSALLISFMVFFRNDFRYDIMKEEQYYRDKASELARKASSCEDIKSIENMLAPYAGNEMQIELLDKNGNTIWSEGKSNTVINFTARDYIIKGGMVEYGLKVSGTFALRSQVIGEYTVRYLWIVLVLFAVLLILIAFFLHLTITKPIYELYKRMESNPLKLKRVKKDYRNDEIGVLEKRFDEMIDRLQAVDGQQQTMLGAISHDLKTPLTSIMIYTERLSSGKVTDEEKQEHYFKVISQKAEDIRILIDKFQDAARIADLDEHADYKIKSASEFWQSVLEPYMEEWDDVDAKLEYECKIDNTVMIKADRESVSRVIANIMGNAVKYGGRPLLVHAVLSQYEGKIRLKIENNGMQVPEDKLPFLFDRFYRAEPSRSREKGGSGLGLFICREIIEKHEGSISAYKPWDNDFGIEILFPIINY